MPKMEYKVGMPAIHPMKDGDVALVIPLNHTQGEPPQIVEANTVILLNKYEFSEFAQRVFDEAVSQGVNLRLNSHDRQKAAYAVERARAGVGKEVNACGTGPDVADRPMPGRG